MKKGTTISMLVALALLISACNFPFVDSESAVADAVAETVAAMEKEAEEVIPTLAPLPTQVPVEPEGPKSGDPCEPGDDDCYSCHPDDDDCRPCDSWNDDDCDRCGSDDDECYYYGDHDWDDKGGWDDDHDDDDKKPSRPEDQCLYATYVSETIPDGTVFSAGEAFTKSWTLENTGYCDWNTDYAIDFKSGNQMGGPDAQDLTEEVDQGEDITISLDLVAPSSAGTYKGVWQLKTDDGIGFGEVWVKIEVE